MIDDELPAPDSRLVRADEAELTALLRSMARRSPEVQALILEVGRALRSQQPDTSWRRR